MLKKFCAVLIFLFVCSFSATLLGNETAKKYFPSTLGSFWVYEDQDGNELTRKAVQGEEIAGEMYHAFEYEPAFEENWEKYEYYVHPTLFKVKDTGIKFLIGDEFKKAYQKRLEKELKDSIQQTGGPPGFTPNYDVKVEVVTQENFFLLPTPFTLNEEWDSMRLKPTVKITMSFANSDVDVELAGMSQQSTIYFTIMETGIVSSKETVETPAGTFKDCLKVEYRTKTVMPSFAGEGGPKAGESVSTLWLAPNVGIVKFHQEAEKPTLSDFNNSETTTQVKTLELKKYEIKTDAAEAE
ncbi:hypothetical protein C6501_19220 [Candidatus Poribacteria bacterium]|nr:MAG: hypothetical protein C6501_19220 [Candidatus Poribacteria bacterium]